MTYSKKYLAKKAEKEAKRMALMTCPRAGGCICHSRGLNTHVLICPICGCTNLRAKVIA